MIDSHHLVKILFFIQTMFTTSNKMPRFHDRQPVGKVPFSDILCLK